MFKSARWRSEKSKVKVVFKLQFHAAKVPHFGDDPLMISVVPTDTGKPTLKSDKAFVRDGSCFWENPLYEAVKFNRDPKSGKIHERIYNFLVGMGSSKAGVIGEASINFSDYAEATKVCLVPLPLKNSKGDAVLNVSIQRMQESVYQREVEESDNAKLNYKVNSLKSQLDNGDEDVISCPLPQQLNTTVSHIAGFNRTVRASSGSDLTISSSDSSSGVETLWLPQTKNESVHQRSQGPKCDAQTVSHEEHQRSQWEWLGNSGLEACTDDSSSTPRETFLRQHLDDSSDSVIEKLKSELAALSRQAAMSELELQALRKQIVKESKRGQDLFRELVFVREERDVLMGECEKLKAKPKASSQFEGGDSRAIIEELSQELDHAKELNSNLRVQLEKIQESNSELILAVKDLDEMLEQKEREIMNLTNGSLTKDVDEMSQGAGPAQQLDDGDDDEEQRALEEIVKEHVDAREAYLLEQQIMDMRSEIEIYRRDKDELEIQMEQLALDYEIMKQENHEMAYKLEQNELQEQLKLQYECSSSYAAAHELEAHIENLENELKQQSKESSDALVKISELEAHIKGLEEDLEKQSQGFEAHKENLENELKQQSKESLDGLVKIDELEAHIKGLEEELEKQSQGFEADLDALTRSKVEQEQRAIRAEEKLAKTRWQNANTADRIQEEFRRLAVLMASTFEANEKLAARASAEANELRLEKSRLEDVIKKASEEKQSVIGHYEDRLHQLACKFRSMADQIEGLQSEIKDKTLQLERQRKHAEETEQLLSNKILKLKDEMETWMAENKILSEDVQSMEMLMREMEQMRISVKEMELLVWKGNAERIELENRIISVKSDAEESEKELNKMRSLLGKKELMVGYMQSELDSLQSQYTELKHSLLENELEKEELRKQVISLEGELKKTEDAHSNMETKMKDMRGRGTTLDAVNEPSETCNTKEVETLKERIMFLEVAALAEKQNPNFRLTEEARNSAEGATDPNISSSSPEALEGPRNNSRHIDELMNEMALLKERNQLMEAELKELQERYSEISLKFAEVEGERQQLVMKVRNLKNKKKS